MRSKGFLLIHLTLIVLCGLLIVVGALVFYKYKGLVFKSPKNAVSDAPLQLQLSEAPKPVLSGPQLEPLSFNIVQLKDGDLWLERKGSGLFSRFTATQGKILNYAVDHKRNRIYYALTDAVYSCNLTEDFCDPKKIFTVEPGGFIGSVNYRAEIQPEVFLSRNDSYLSVRYIKPVTGTSHLYEINQKFIDLSNTRTSDLFSSGQLYQYGDRVEGYPNLNAFPYFGWLGDEILMRFSDQATVNFSELPLKTSTLPNRNANIPIIPQGGLEKLIDDATTALVLVQLPGSDIGTWYISYIPDTSYESLGKELSLNQAKELLQTYPSIQITSYSRNTAQSSIPALQYMVFDLDGIPCLVQCIEDICKFNALFKEQTKFSAMGNILRVDITSDESFNKKIYRLDSGFNFIELRKKEFIPSDQRISSNVFYFFEKDGKYYTYQSIPPQMFPLPVAVF